MARGSGGRKRRPRPDAGQRSDAPLNPETGDAEGGAGSASSSDASLLSPDQKRALIEARKEEAHQRRQAKAQAARAETQKHAGRKQESYEDTMFFPRLRKRAKPVFVLLAAAFAIGFVALGVGTGVSGSSLGDVIRDVFGGGTDQPSISDAQDKLEKDPNDIEALRELATAYVAAGQRTDAAATYERLVALAPTDAEALSQLAGLYARDVNEAFNRVGALQASSQNPFNDPAGSVPADSTGFVTAIMQDPIGAAINDQGQELVARETAKAQALARRAAVAFQRIALADPENPLNWQQLGQYAQAGALSDVAADAYLRALRLDPEGPDADNLRTLVLINGGTLPPELQPVLADTTATDTTATDALAETAPAATDTAAAPTETAPGADPAAGGTDVAPPAPAETGAG
ncbi:MAG: hypothetical protein R3C15_11335 [Thermoleophilia bacterium]